MTTKHNLAISYLTLWSEYTCTRDIDIDGLNWKDEREKFILAFFARVNSLTEDILILASKNRYTSSEILMRSALETYVELKCLLVDPDHVFIVKNTQTKKEIDYLKNYSPSNVYFAHTNQIESEKRLKFLYSKYDEKLNMKLYRKFEKAGELDAYRTVYHRLCLSAHGNITALASNNFDTNEGSIVLERNPTDITIKLILTSAINLAIACCIEILDYFSFEKATIDKYKNIMEQVGERTKTS